MIHRTDLVHSSSIVIQNERKRLIEPVHEIVKCLDLTLTHLCGCHPLCHSPGRTLKSFLIEVLLVEETPCDRRSAS